MTRVRNDNPSVATSGPAEYNIRMQHRTHDQLQWHDHNHDTGAWQIYVRCQLLGSVKVDIPSRNPDGLTPTQDKCLQMVRDLSQEINPVLIDALRNYALAIWGTEPTTEDLSFTCEHVSVPYLEHADTLYVFLDANSPVDEEHGVCFLIRDGNVVCCHHGDTSLQFEGWDNTGALDELADDFK